MLLLLRVGRLRRPAFTGKLILDFLLFFRLGEKVIKSVVFGQTAL